MDPRMNGSVTGNCSAAISVLGKSGHNVEAIKRNGRPPTDNATTHTPTRGNHRTRSHKSNNPPLSRHHSTNPHHHVHYRCFSSLHARPSRVRHCTKVRNTTGQLSRRCLQELPQLYTTAHLDIPDDSAGNPLQRFQAYHSQLLRNNPMGLSTDIPTHSYRPNNQGRNEHSQRPRRQEHLQAPTDQLAQQTYGYEPSSIKTGPEVRINPIFVIFRKFFRPPLSGLLGAVAEFFQSGLDQNDCNNHRGGCWDPYNT